MRVDLLLGALGVTALVAADVGGGPPNQWELMQNDPDPFCGTTVIRFAAPQSAHARLTVWSPDESAVVRTLVDGVIAAGFYSVAWDQRDDDGILLPSESYPYQLLATDPDTGAKLFEAWLVATVACEPSPELDESWGRVKDRYAFDP